MNALESLKQYTTVVADTGDFQTIKQFTPQDATTNPSLILAASQIPAYAHLVDQAVAGAGSDVDLATTMLLVGFGCEILKLIPGRVSTEVDARFSYDTAKTLVKARQIIALYESKGINKSRVLIKIASTWEGIKAAEILQQEGIHCNLTLLFSLTQAIACAEAGVTLISPFVGRILDWYKKQQGDIYTQLTDPGVLSVQEIYRYYKTCSYSTIVMGASFRNVGEIEELTGCDFLTISPTLLKELSGLQKEFMPRLAVGKVEKKARDGNMMDEAGFREGMKKDLMATEKLADGIKQFSVDGEKLEALVAAKIAK